MSIEVKNLNFSYGKRLILDDVNFTAYDSQLLSVLGPNGVGKSTLFSCILGLKKNYTGNILLDGKDIKFLNIKERAELISYIPQSHFPSFNYSVFDMVLMGTTVHLSAVACPGKKQEKLAEEALEKLGILHLKNRGYTQISGGERQLVLMARALVQDAKILILDEPTANLDFGNQIKVLTQIKSLTEDGYTIIQSTHNPDQTFMFSDAVIAMKDGKIIANGIPCDVVTKDIIQSLYTADVEIQSMYNDKVRVCIPKCAI